MKSFLRNNWGVILLVIIVLGVSLKNNYSARLKVNHVSQDEIKDDVIDLSEEALTENLEIENREIFLSPNQTVMDRFVQDDVLYFLLAEDLLQGKYSSMYTLHQYDLSGQFLLEIKKEYPFSLKLLGIDENYIIYEMTDTREVSTVEVYDRKTEEVRTLYRSEAFSDKKFTYGRGILSVIEGGQLSLYSMTGDNITKDYPYFEQENVHSFFSHQTITGIIYEKEPIVYFNFMDHRLNTLSEVVISSNLKDFDISNSGIVSQNNQQKKQINHLNLQTLVRSRYEVSAEIRTPRWIKDSTFSFFDGQKYFYIVNLNKKEVVLKVDLEQDALKKYSPYKKNQALYFLRPANTLYLIEFK